MCEYVLPNVRLISHCVVLVQQNDDRVCSVRIQSGGRFIQKQQRGRGDELHPDAAPLPFTSRYATQKLCTYLHTHTHTQKTLDC